MDDGSLGVYVHVPFCERVCPYCDFAVVAARRLEPAREEAYVAALLTELGLRAPALEGRRVASVYLGGGTPSLLHPGSIERILAATARAFRARDPIEVTLEMNPGTTERERLPAFRAAGVNRLSIGVQSFDDGVLKRLGRAHRAGEARLALRAARDAGYENVSLDLVFAAPGGSEAQLARDLDEAVGFAPEHVSAYELTIEAGTPFERAARRGQLALPGEEEGVRLFELVEEKLESAGLARYEISSFARPGRASLHNRRYWERLPVLGLGMGAWSIDPPDPRAPFGARRMNLRDLDAYLGRCRQVLAPDAGPRELLAEPTARGEAVFLALRTVRGLDAASFVGEFGSPPRAFFAREIDELAAAGLLEEAGEGDLRLTHRGRLVSDAVFEKFVRVEPEGGSSAKPGKDGLVGAGPGP